jgi:hypothetical protein
MVTDKTGPQMAQVITDGTFLGFIQAISIGAQKLHGIDNPGSVLTRNPRDFR